MKQNRHFSFYMEVMIMLVVFIAVIVNLSRVFTLSRRQSWQARQLSDAVILASSGAEICASCRSEEELLELLQDAGAKRSDAGITASFNDRFEMDPSGEMIMEIGWLPEGEKFVETPISISCNGTEIYTLNTGHYLGGGQP